MITHIFNSSIVSGPEMLVIPALRRLKEPVSIIFLTEDRLMDVSRRPIDYAKNLGHTVYSVPVRGRYDRQAFKELRELLDRLPSRVVHAHDVKASLYLYQATKVRPGFETPIVSTHHGASYRKGKIRLYEEFYVRMILPHYDLVLSVCEQDRVSIVKRGVPAAKVKTHLNGTDRREVRPIDRFEISKQIRLQWQEKMPTLPNPDEALFLGTVARLSPEKRHDRMMQVLNQLKSFPTLTLKPILLFFGTGAEEAKLRELAQELNLQDSVFFMGYSNTISEEMAGFDLYFCLSDGEGIPISLLEAAWAATPVVATRVGGIPDLISAPEFGLLVDKKEKDQIIADQVEDLLLDHAKQADIGRQFQMRVKMQFSEDAWLKHLLQFYESLEKQPTRSTVQTTSVKN